MRVDEVSILNVGSKVLPFEVDLPLLFLSSAIYYDMSCPSLLISASSSTDANRRKRRKDQYRKAVAGCNASSIEVNQNFA